jgi:UDP-glucose 4-epimerase
MAHVLITGGAGFLGSHTCVALLQAGHRLVVLDNFSNSGPEALRRVAALAGLGVGSVDQWPQAGDWRLRLVRGDIRQREDVEAAFRAGEGAIDAVIHFAGLKAVAESVRDPLAYWDVNVGGSRCLLAVMGRLGCRTLVFSSSATLYGFPDSLPIAETAPVRPINPYGNTKAAVEQLLADTAASASGWRIACLRYFNPVGAHPSGRIGEDPSGVPNNLFPFLSQVAVGRRPALQVYGGDWPTVDGTGVRDFIHVMDLAEGHTAALDLLWSEPPQRLTLNLGSGRGHSVLEVVRAFERASGLAVPYVIAERRAGDVASSVADPALAAARMGWHTRRDLDAMCRDGWAWQRANPKGYAT